MAYEIDDDALDRWYKDPQDVYDYEIEEPYVVCGCCDEKIRGKYYNLPVDGIVCWDCLTANYEYTV